MLKKIDRLLGRAVTGVKKNIRVISVILVIGCSVFMLFKGVVQNHQIAENKRHAAYLSDSIEYEKKRQSEIEDLKDKVDTDEYIEKIASDKLGLVKNNAKIFIDVSE